MTDEIKLTVGGSLAEDLSAFRHEWERPERGETAAPDRVLACESGQALAG